MRFGISHTLFALVALTATTATAAAQQVPDHEAPLGSSAARGDVSQINGQLVPVGTHNEYYYSFKRTNIATNPIGAMVGFYSLSLSYGLNQNLALRGDVTYYAPVGEDETGIELSVGAPIYLRRTYQGAFVEPGVMLRRMTNGSSYDGSVSSSEEVGPQVLLGWHWLWDSGLNAAVAFGVGRDFSDKTDVDEYESGGEDIFVNGYLRIGYAF